MAYRYGEREQMDLFPPSIEDYVAMDNPVRAYNAFVEALNFNELGITINEHRVGNSAYHPRAMLKLLVYGYAYGFRSSRKLERAGHDNFSFIWLMAGMKPDHKTIANFRVSNKQALKKVLAQCARMCIKLDLIAGNTLFVDGSKIRANAADDNTWTLKRTKRILARIDGQIEHILSECEKADEDEKDQSSPVKMREHLKDKNALKSKIENIVKELKDTEKKSVNTTDPDCGQMKDRNGAHAGYNAQIVVDGKHGLIVNSDVTNESNDLNQFARQISSANETLKKPCESACADAGYANTAQLQEVDKQDIKVIVPSQRQATHKAPKPFGKERFRYDAANDCYICPEGHRLPYRRFNRRKRHNVYQIAKPSTCHRCRHFGICTNAKNGKNVSRLANEEIREKLEAQYEQPESRAIYKLRKQNAELPFGHLKRNLGIRAFLMKGRDSAKAEMSLMSSCFNMRRMITILGVTGLIAALRA